MDRLRFPLIALGLVAGLLAACEGGAKRPACPANEVCLEYGNNIEPLTLDPHKSNLVDEATVISDMMMGLTTDAADGSPAPGAAERWETSADGLVWTFYLRDAKWSDGQPVTANDFVYGLRRVLAPETASIYAYLAYVLKNGQAVNEGKAPPEALGVRALGPRTVEIALAHPAPYLPELLKHPSFFPAPEHVVRKYGDSWVQPGRYVSNGAYMLKSWRLGDHIQAVKNPNFWDAKNLCIDRVNYYPTPDAVTAERRIAQGELDLNTNFQSNRIDRIRRELPGYPRTSTIISTSYMSFNTRSVPALRDKRVRRALSESIDREFITAKLMRAGQTPAYAFVPPGTAGAIVKARADFADKSFADRQAEARALLAQAGYTATRPLTLEIKIANNTDSALISQAIQADWQAIGVKATIVQNEGQVAFAAYRARDFQIATMSWLGDFNDPLTFLGLLKSDTGAQNYGDYKNPAYDALLNAADNEPDGVRRAEILARAEQMMLDDVALAPIYFWVSRNLVDPKISGFENNPPNFHRVRWMCMPPARPAG